MGEIETKWVELRDKSVINGDPILTEYARHYFFAGAFAAFRLIESITRGAASSDPSELGPTLERLDHIRDELLRHADYTDKLSTILHSRT